MTIVYNEKGDIITVVHRKARNGMICYKGQYYPLQVKEGACSAHITVNTSPTKRIYSMKDIRATWYGNGVVVVSVVHRLQWVHKRYFMKTEAQAKKDFLQWLNFEYEGNV